MIWTKATTPPKYDLVTLKSVLNSVEASGDVINMLSLAENGYAECGHSTEPDQKPEEVWETIV